MIAAGMLAAVLLAGVLAYFLGQSAAGLCDSSETQEALFARLREDYPNKASQEMVGYGSVSALNRILKANGLSRDKPDDLARAATIGTEEARNAYKTGHYVLENVAIMEKGEGAALSCSGRVVFLTAWGIVVKLVTWDVASKADGVDVKLTGMR